MIVVLEALSVFIGYMQILTKCAKSILIYRPVRGQLGPWLIRTSAVDNSDLG